jgi:hypothetical protein
MRSHLRTLIVLLAAALLGWCYFASIFGGVAREIVHARFDW